MKDYKNVDAYLGDVPASVLKVVKQMRALAKKLVPGGEEAIRYGMPTIQLNGKNFIHFAAMKGHLGFYPAPLGVKAVKAELEKRGISYSKGCIRFPYGQPLPVALVSKVIRFRLREVGARGKEWSTSR